MSPLVARLRSTGKMSNKASLNAYAGFAKQKTIPVQALCATKAIVVRIRNNTQVLQRWRDIAK